MSRLTSRVVRYKKRNLVVLSRQEILDNLRVEKAELFQTKVSSIEQGIVPSLLALNRGRKQFAMGVFYETIPDSLVPWIKAQQMLWVGTAPLSGEGHINISPKGGQNFGIIDECTFWYMDLTGSGVETHAHLHEEGNGRICVMVSSF